MSEILGRRQFLELCLKVPLALVIPRFTPVQIKEADISEELVLNERVSEILSLVVPLSFDTQGNLARETEGGELITVAARPTEYSREQTETVEEVALLIVHYDANERFWEFDNYRVERNAESIVGLLDRNGYSAHWCVDGFPISDNENGEGGYGILQTQPGSDDPNLPLIGAHVKMDIEDESKLRTLEVFNRLGISSNLQGLYNRKVESFNFHTVGFEQVGTEFDQGFPAENQPDNQQIANALSLTIAVMRQYDLTPWEVLGHHEVQELKIDPGDYYMATLRFLLGVAALTGKIQADIVFRGENPRSYFRKIEQYLSIVDRYGRLHAWKSFMGYENFIESLPRSVPVRHQRGLIE